MTEPAGATGPARFERRRADWLGIEDALARILSRAHPLAVEEVPLDAAVGRALAEPVVAPATLPPWDNSAMDGYAVRGADVRGATADTPVRLAVVGVVRAGEPSRRAVGPGEAIRIMTGGPIPEGADTVVRVEDTDAEARDGVVHVVSDRDVGRHIRPAGRDMSTGETLLTEGHGVTVGTVGVLAAAGRMRVRVRRRPSVALLSTGDELRDVGRYQDVRRGLGVPDSNRPMLAAMIRAAGGEPVDLGIAGDIPEELERRIREGAGHDALVTIGGASMGDADLVKRVLDGLGYRPDFWRVRMRPGSPFGFGAWPTPVGDQPVFGIPGNPASAFVTFELFVRPWLLRCAGHERVGRRVVSCRLADPIEAPAALTHLHRVRLRATADGLEARLTGSQGSGLVTGLARADGLAVIPEDTTRLEPGDEVAVMLLDAWIEAPSES